MSLRLKMFTAFGALVLLSALGGALTLWINSRIQIDLEQIEQGSLGNALAAERMSAHLIGIILERHRIAEELPHGSRMAAFAPLLNDFEASLTASKKAAARSLELAKKDAKDHEVASAQEQIANLDDLKAGFETWKELVQKSFIPEEHDHSMEAAIREEDDRLVALAGRYKRNASGNLQEETRDIRSAVRRANAALLSCILIVLVVGLLMTCMVPPAICRPIGKLLDAVQRIGAGDLASRVEVQSKDEFEVLGRAFNQMTTDLQSTSLSKDYVDSILRSIADTLIVLNPDRTIGSVNQATVKLLGYSETELEGRPIASLVALDEGNLKLNGNGQKPAEPMTGKEVVYRAKDGSEIPVSLSLSYFEVRGALDGLVLVAQDITERKEADARLQTAQSELVKASRGAGMAEVATSVLHNVGNVLNSVNVSASMITDHLKNSRVSNIEKIAALLKENEADLGKFMMSERGRQLVSYLGSLAEHLGREQETGFQEADALQKNIEHIKEIVAMQQSYARISGIKEEVSIVDVVEDSLRLNASALSRHNTKLIRDYEEVPRTAIERHKVLQILVNLIRNAKYACDESGREDKEIVLRVRYRAGSCRITVADNGVGIVPENLTRIFSHGFTTRAEGHGFGLHSAAVAAKELGGTLTVQTDGPGKGAAFTLELPLAVPILPT